LKILFSVPRDPIWGAKAGLRGAKFI
jgi:hypothetical protein